MSETAPVLKEVFCKALECGSAGERARYLSEACSDNAALRREVEGLLGAFNQAGSFLEAPGALALGDREPEAAPGDPTIDQLDERPGTVIGPYKLLEQIGEGGFGVVFMAEQSHPVRRKVALKILKPGMDTRQVVARFEAERQALAIMDHPNIAKVLDAGETTRGRPFFVMELVKGLPITEFCDQAKLPPRDRLELFASVCQAVQHAHQKGIIHRDLKPSNVLVSRYDSTPVVKVIDFGVAKALGQELTDKTLFTGLAQMIGTPLYMSPEQAGMSDLDIDTRSDIYSLGVLLYELLTGTTPFDKQRLKEASYDEIRRIIREEEPAKPSTRISTLGQAASTVSTNRQSDPRRLSQLFRGELDWIVMKALEKDRNRRYETAKDFAADVQRYLADEIVEARPPSTSYRLWKFVRHNRPQVIAGSLVLLALLVGMAGTALGLIEARRQEGFAHAEAKAKDDALQAEAAEHRKADLAKTEAQAKEAEANAVVTFFQDQVFAAARPEGQAGGLGAGVSLRDAIAASEPALDKGFVKQPLVEARLRMTLGITFSYLAEHDQARIQFERARALYTQNRGPDHPETLASMHDLANSYADLNRPTEAFKLHEVVLAIRKRVLPPDHPSTLASMHSLADSYTDLNRPTEALKLHEVVLAIRKRVLPPDHPDTLLSMNNLAGSYYALNRPTEALKLFEDVLAIQKRVLPKDHPNTLLSMNNLAISYYAQKRPHEALKLFEEVVAIQKRVLPKDHPDTLLSMTNLASSYAVLNRQDEALKLSEEVVAIQKRVLPKEHPNLLASMYNLALTYATLNRQDEALKLNEEVVAIQKRVLPKDHPDTLGSMSNLARSYAALNRHADALPLVNEVLAKADRPGVDPRLVPFAIGLRLQCCRKANDPAGCRTSAEMWEKLDRPDAGSLYNAACYRAVTAAVQAKTPGAAAARLAQEDADKAMAWLTKAVAAGYSERARLEKDTALDFLREREDFKKVVAEVREKK